MVEATSDSGKQKPFSFPNSDLGAVARSWFLSLMESGSPCTRPAAFVRVATLENAQVRSEESPSRHRCKNGQRGR